MCKKPPLLAISAHSGTGKTTLLQKIIPLLTLAGIRVAAIKHSHHNMDIDIPGKDSYLLRKAGALQTIVACDNRWALMTETPEKITINLESLVAKLDLTQTDLVLVEGFKNEPIHKILLSRKDIGEPFSHVADPLVIAIACDYAIEVSIPVLDLNNPTQVTDFIINWLKKSHSISSGVISHESIPEADSTIFKREY